MTEMELKPVDRVWERMSYAFGADITTLKRICDELGVVNNLKGEIVDDQFVTLSGEKFAYNAETMMLNETIRIREDGEIHGFPMSTTQRSAIEAILASTTAGALYVLRNDVLEMIDVGVTCATSRYAIHYIDASKRAQRVDLLNQDMRTSIDLDQDVVHLVTSDDYAFFLTAVGTVWRVGDTSIKRARKLDVENVVEIACDEYRVVCRDTKGQIWISNNGSNKVTLLEGIEGAQQIVTEGRRLFVLEANGDVTLIEGDKRTRLDGFEGVRRLFVGFKRGAYLDAKGQIWRFALDNPVPKIFGGFEGVKDVALGSIEEAPYDLVLDADHRIWLVEGDRMSILNELSRPVKSFSSGYCVTLIA